MIAHILYYFSDQNDLVFDPMAGGGVVADTCLALNRKCWSFDMDDRTETRPEVEPYFWDITNLKWPIKGKTKPDLIIFDPPYFKKQSNNYDPDGISGMSKANYLKFLENFFALAHLNAKKSTQMAFINADWRDFQSTPAKNETRENSILINDYLRILDQSGWQETHIFQAPLSSERFQANVVSAMQKKKIIGVTSRYVIMSKKKQVFKEIHKERGCTACVNCVLAYFVDRNKDHSKGPANHFLHPRPPSLLGFLSDPVVYNFFIAINYVQVIANRGDKSPGVSLKCPLSRWDPSS